MATLETLDFLFKSKGKDSIIKEIQEIEKKWNNVTKSITDTVSLLDKLRESKKVFIDIERARANTFNRESKRDKTRIAAAKAEEKAYKERGRAAKEEAKIVSKTAGRATRGTQESTSRRTDWGQWGGLASVMSLGIKAAKAVTQTALSGRDIGLSVGAIAKATLSDPNKIKKLLGILISSGTGKPSEITSFLSDISNKWLSAYFGGDKELFENFALAGADIKTTDFPSTMMSMIKAVQKATSPEEQQRILKGLSGISPQAYGIFSQANLKNTTDYLGNLERQIEAGKKWQETLNRLEESLRKVTTAATPAVEALSNLAAKTTDWLNDVSKKVSEVTGMDKDKSLLLTYGGAFASLIAAWKALTNPKTTANLIRNTAKWGWGGLKSLAKNAPKAIRPALFPGLLFTPQSLGDDTLSSRSRLFSIDEVKEFQDVLSKLPPERKYYPEKLALPGGSNIENTLRRVQQEINLTINVNGASNDAYVTGRAIGNGVMDSINGIKNFY